MAINREALPEQPNPLDLEGIVQRARRSALWLAEDVLHLLQPLPARTAGHAVGAAT